MKRKQKKILEKAFKMLSKFIFRSQRKVDMKNTGTFQYIYGFHKKGEKLFSRKKYKINKIFYEIFTSEMLWLIDCIFPIIINNSTLCSQPILRK